MPHPSRDRHRELGRDAALILCLLLSALGAAAEREKPVAELAQRALDLQTAAGPASIPIDASEDPGAVHPEITRAVIVFHGKGRDVAGYYAALQRAAETAGSAAHHTLLLAPQFLREEDVEAHRLPARFLRWHAGSWTEGEGALGPAPLSSFDVIDALLALLTDRQRYAQLGTVVLMGHSGGGQLLNRYAVVGRQPAMLAAAGVHLRFVIANPSSYLYFNDDRPLPDGSFAPYRAAACAKFDHWRYGPIQAPPYVADASDAAWQRREQDYVASDVIYLLGLDDTDPHQVDLDTSCAGEAQGRERLDRGKAYVRYLANRHPKDFRGRLWFVPGVAHSGGRMVDSSCAIAALFDQGRCADQAAIVPASTN
jgi:hypothetical protein